MVSFAVTEWVGLAICLTHCGWKRSSILTYSFCRTASGSTTSFALRKKERLEMHYCYSQYFRLYISHFHIYTSLPLINNILLSVYNIDALGQARERTVHANTAHIVDHVVGHSLALSIVHIDLSNTTDHYIN